MVFKLNSGDPKGLGEAPQSCGLGEKPRPHLPSLSVAAPPSPLVQPRVSKNVDLPAWRPASDHRGSSEDPRLPSCPSHQPRGQKGLQTERNATPALSG